MLNWDDLRYFLALYREKSLSSAAKELKVNHVTVSRRVSELEEALGVRLFRQTSRGFVPTQEGEAFLPVAEDVERRVSSVSREVRAGVYEIRGKATIATVDSIAQRWLMPNLAGLRQRYPGLEVEVKTDFGFHNLEKGEADLAVRGFRPAQRGLSCYRLGSLSFYLYASKDYRRRRAATRASDLEGHDLVLYGKDMEFIQDARWFAPAIRQSRSRLYVDSAMLAMQAAIEGQGAAILPEFCAESARSLERLSPRELRGVEMWLVMYPDVARDPRVRALADFIKELAQGPRSFDPARRPDWRRDLG